MITTLLPLCRQLACPLNSPPPFLHVLLLCSVRVRCTHVAVVGFLWLYFQSPLLQVFVGFVRRNVAIYFDMRFILLLSNMDFLVATSIFLACDTDNTQTQASPSPMVSSKPIIPSTPPFLLRTPLYSL